MGGNQKNKDYKIIWSSKFAYAIGLLTSDGNLSKDGRHFTLTSKDKDLLKSFKNCLNLKSKLGMRIGGYTGQKNYYHIQFSNKRLYNYLLTIGLTPNKSKTIGSLKIPDKYFFHFLRGHFDGDGSCYSFWDKRWKNSFMFYTCFTSTSINYLNWLQAKIQQKAKIKGSIKRGTEGYHLQYAKHNSLILWKKMYYIKELPCLLRKRKRIEKILKTQVQVAESEDAAG